MKSFFHRLVESKLMKFYLYRVKWSCKDSINNMTDYAMGLNRNLVDGYNIIQLQSVNRANSNQIVQLYGLTQHINQIENE